MKFTSFHSPDFASIPPRKWLYDERILAGNLTLTVSPGGLGKSSLLIAEVLAMCTGRSLLGVRPVHPLRVVLWNGEDPYEELQRRIAATMKHFGLTNEDIGKRLAVASGRDLPFCLNGPSSTDDNSDAEKANAIAEAIEACGAEVMVIDPFITTHSVSENDNMAINSIITIWRQVVQRTGCAIEIVHHSTKGGASGGAADDRGIAQSRGATALIDGVRNARFLTPMSVSQATEAGLDSPAGHFHVSTGKANFTGNSRKPAWFKIVPVALENSTAEYPDGDKVGVVVPWRFEPVRAEFTTENIAAIQKALSESDWRKDPQCKNWVGFLIGDVLGLDAGRGLKKKELPKDRLADRQLVQNTMTELLKSGAIKVVSRPDSNRMLREFIDAGTLVELPVHQACPTHSGLGKSGGASEATVPHATRPTPTLSPLGEGGVGGAGDVDAPVDQQPRQTELQFDL